MIHFIINEETENGSMLEQLYWNILHNSNLTLKSHFNIKKGIAGDPFSAASCESISGNCNPTFLVQYRIDKCAQEKHLSQSYYSHMLSYSKAVFALHYIVE